MPKTETEYAITYGPGGFDPNSPTENIVEVKELTYEVEAGVDKLRDVAGRLVEIAYERRSPDPKKVETVFLDVDNHPDHEWKQKPKN